MTVCNPHKIHKLVLLEVKHLKSFTQESLRIIKKASEDNKLVIVVGAGVSMLSNFPSWKEVIDRFSGPFSEQKERYSQNEYLRIPQKYYNLRGHKEYYDLLRDIFDVDLQSNRIHDEILNLNPVHLITTNYDDLLEKAIDARGLFYDVIAKDEEVSQTRTKSFLIKMHGDVKHQNVVLKENDYLSYSSQFRLIETMVKSVIASNITIFIGYSLNDRNMKLILNWVKELQGSSFQPVYLLYLEQKLDQNNFDYYKSQGIHVIDVNHFVSDVNEVPYEQRYLTFFQALAKLNLDELYRHHKEEDRLLYRLSPLEELTRVRLKDLRHLLQEEVTETGVLKLSKAYVLDVSTCWQLKKAGIKTVIFPDGSEHVIQNENKNYLLPPYTSGLTECMNQGEGMWHNYHRAYYQFKHGNLLLAYDLYKKTAAEAFKGKHYLLHFLAQFNRYWTGRTIQRLLSGEEAERVIDEIRQLNLEILYHHLPATFKRKYAFLCDLSNFYFIYKYLNDIIQLINALSTSKDVLETLNFKAQELFEFMDENLLVIDEYLEVSHLYKSYIEARLYHDSEVLDSFTLHLIIKYMSVDELQHLMQRIHRKQLQTVYVDELILYAKQLLSYCSKHSLSALMKIQLEKMSQTILALLSVVKMNEEELLKVLDLLFTKELTRISMPHRLAFLQSQLTDLSIKSSEIECFLEEQLTQQFIKKYLLNETIDSSYTKLASFLTKPIPKLSHLIELHLEQIDSFELVSLTSVMVPALTKKVSDMVAMRLWETFNFDLLMQAFSANLNLSYQAFESLIKEYVQEHGEALPQLGELIACHKIESLSFEELLLQNDCAYFLAHYEEIESTPIEMSWFWKLPFYIHERIAKTFHQPVIERALIEKIRLDEARDPYLSLYFDIYRFRINERMSLE